MCNASDQFQKKEIQKLAIFAYVLQNTQNLIISRCCFAKEGYEMYKDRLVVVALPERSF